MAATERLGFRQTFDRAERKNMSVYGIQGVGYEPANATRPGRCSQWQRPIKRRRQQERKKEAVVSQRPCGASNFMCHQMMHRIIAFCSSTKTKEKKKKLAATSPSFICNLKRR